MRKILVDEFCGILEDLKNAALGEKTNDNVLAYRVGGFVFCELDLGGIRMVYSQHDAIPGRFLTIEDPVNKKVSKSVQDSTLYYIELKYIDENMWGYKIPGTAEYARLGVDDLYTKYCRMVELHNAIEAGTATGIIHIG